MKNRVREVVKTSLATTLKPLGFEERRDVYLRKIGRIEHIVDVQYSRWNDANETSFTVNCGVYIPGVTSAFRSTPEPRYPKLTDCCLSARVGMLTDSRLDVWWKISSDDGDEQLEKIRADLIAITAQVVIPFVDRFRDESKVSEFLSRSPSERDALVEPRAEGLRLVYAGIIWKILGEEVRSKDCLERAVLRAKKTPLESLVSAFVEGFA